MRITIVPRIAARLLATSVLSTGLFSISTAFAADWMQFGYDATHSGNNTAETILTQANVDQLQRRYQATLPSSVDSAPIYLSGVSTSGGTRDLLFLLAEDGTLMAIDAADGSVVWSHQESGNQPTMSAPAIDPGRQYIYAYGLDGFAHKYHVDTGSEVTSGGWPELITLKPDVEKAAGSFTIGTSGGTNYLYVVTDGYSGDAGDYQGHLTSINLSDGTQNVFNSLCSDNPTHLDHGGNNCDRPHSDDFGGSGIWGRGGATFNVETNRVYVTTGNGWFDANMAGFNWGDSILSLLPAGTQAGGLPDDSYTPDDFLTLFDEDVDLGSVSLAILPVPPGQGVTHLGAQLGKDAYVRLIDLDNMSGSNVVGSVGGELQLIYAPQRGNNMSEQPAVWVDPNGVTWLLIANNSGVSAMKLRFSNTGAPYMEEQWQHPDTAKSSIVANGVLYYAADCGGSYCMYAADPVTGNVLWTSTEHLANLHWQSPILVNGAIYIADGTNLHRFDIGAQPTHTVTPSAGPNGSIAPDTPQTVDDGDTTSFTVTPDAHYAIADVTGCGGQLSGNTYTTGPITSDCTVSATFAIITHTVTPDAGDGTEGTIEPATPQTVDDGATTSFTVTPAAHYRIADVTGCGGELSGDTYTTGPITADCTVSATFEIVTHTVTPDAGDGTEGAIDPDTPQTVDDGATTSFTITPNASFRIDTVTGCGGSLAGTIYTTGPISADCTVLATFAALTDPIFANGFDAP